MILIVPYSPKYESKHIEFASKYWEKSRRKIPEYIYWKFRGKNNNDLNSFLLAVDNGEVVGQLGVIPCKISINGAIYESQWACDLMVDISYRGKGVAKELYKYAHRMKPITLGSDPSIAASKSMKFNGYDSIKGPWNFLFPFNINEITILKGFNNKILNNIKNPILMLFYIINKVFNCNFKQISVNQFYEIINEEKIDTNFIKVAHDKDFINWRLKPFKKYHPANDAYKNRNSCFTGYYVNNSYYITNFYVKNIFEFFKIITFLVYKYSKNNIRRIRFKSNLDFISKWLLFFGFVKFRTRTEVIYYTDNQILKNTISKKIFHYTYLDSDENI